MTRSFRSVIEELGGVKQINNQERQTIDYPVNTSGHFNLTIPTITLGDTKVNAIMLALHADKNIAELSFGAGDGNSKGNISASYRKARGKNTVFQGSVDLAEYQNLTEDLFGMTCNPNFGDDTDPKYHYDYVIIPVGNINLKEGDTLQINFNAIKYSVISTEAVSITASVSFIEFGNSELTDYLYQIDKVEGNTVSLSNVIQLDLQKEMNYIEKESDYVKVTSKGNSYQFYANDSSVLCQALSDIDVTTRNQEEITSICRFDSPIDCTVNVNYTSGKYKNLYAVSIIDVDKIGA